MIPPGLSVRGGDGPRGNRRDAGIFICFTWRLRVLAVAIVLLTTPAGGAADYPPVPMTDAPEGAWSVTLQAGDDGVPLYRIAYEDGRAETLTAEQYARRIWVERRAGDRRPWWQQLLNISTPIGIAWVTLGMLGQILFTGRMIVQWLVSEKNKRSTIPTAFWWMSLIGATMLIIYFAWRKDIVGIFGQTTGWLIYLRNLRLIYKEKRQPAVG